MCTEMWWRRSCGRRVCRVQPMENSFNGIKALVRKTATHEETYAPDHDLLHRCHRITRRSKTLSRRFLLLGALLRTPHRQSRHELLGRQQPIALVDPPRKNVERQRLVVAERHLDPAGRADRV